MFLSNPLRPGQEKEKEEKKKKTKTLGGRKLNARLRQLPPSALRIVVVIGMISRMDIDKLSAKHGTSHELHHRVCRVLAADLEVQWLI